jgi:hypothetical protein
MSIRLLDFFYLLLKDYFLSNNFYLSNLNNSVYFFDDFFDYLRDFFYSFHNLNDWNRFLYNSIHYCVLNLNVVLHLSGISILYDWYDFLNNLLDFDDLRNLHCFFYYFLHIVRNLFDYFDYFLNRNENLSNNLNLFNLFLNVVYNSFDNHYSIHLNNFLLHSLDLNDSGDLFF